MCILPLPCPTHQVHRAYQMPRMIHYDNRYNKELYRALMVLFSAWEWPTNPPAQTRLVDSSPAPKFNKSSVKPPSGKFPSKAHATTDSPASALALSIAHESHLARRIEDEKLNQGKSSAKRKSDVSRYLETLQKARRLWASMENDDQKSLSQCMEDLKLQQSSGHEILETMEYDVILKSYKQDYKIASWRTAELSKHDNWGMDTEMLDLLITNANHWLEHKAPVAQERLDPVLYAVMYMAEECENMGINPSYADNSNFTKIVTMYLNFTYPERENPMYPRDTILKANELLKA